MCLYQVIVQKNFINQIESLYKKSEQLLSTGAFGSGLWPVDLELGQLMQWLIRSFQLKNGLEVGAGVGYSTAWLAEGFRYTGGYLTSFEYFLPKVEQWEVHMQQLFGADYHDVVGIVPADVTKWVQHAGRKKLDFVFFDQRKGDYLLHLKLLMPLLKTGAILCADNVSSHASACADYLDFVKNDQRFESMTLDRGAGLELSRFLGSSE